MERLFHEIFGERYKDYKRVCSQHAVKAAFREALELLPPDMSHAVLSYYVKGEELDTVASELGVSRHTAQNYILHGVEMMRQPICSARITRVIHVA